MENKKHTNIFTIIIIIIAIVLVLYLFSSNKGNKEKSYEDMYYDVCDRKDIPRQHARGLYIAYRKRGYTSKEMYEAALKWDNWRN